MSTIVGNGFGGRQPNQTAYIKQYYASTDNGIAYWYFVDSPAYGTSNLITPSNAGVNVLLTGDLTVQGNATFEKDITVMGTIYNPSDVNLKTEIEEITKLDIENLGNLEPKKYVLKNDENKSPHYGLIAQDVERFFPHLVKDDEIGFKKVNYLELIPLLIGKINKMQGEIDNLTNIISLLKERQCFPKN